MLWLGSEERAWLVSAVVIIVLWETVKRVLRVLVERSKRSQQIHEEGWGLSKDEFPDLNIPEHPHVEVALDPPTGLHYSNPASPFAFQNDFCSGGSCGTHGKLCYSNS